MTSLRRHFALYMSNILHSKDEKRLFVPCKEHNFQQFRKRLVILKNLKIYIFNLSLHYSSASICSVSLSICPVKAYSPPLWDEKGLSSICFFFFLRHSPQQCWWIQKIPPHL